ncbi:MAG: chorismate synthase [Candidatus Margulisbacteria bacterium]|nr:chorismate synthase [Candidatus Margulisiibacteriota bacterium]
MAGNTFGRLFRMTTFGESHGIGIGVVLDGVPPYLPLSEADIQFDLDRRRPGTSHIVTPRKESDTVEIISGVFEGQTTGTPLALFIRNTNQKSKDYSNIKDVFRPGHADFTYSEKYGIRDYRGGGRSSGRETAARVAAGAVAKKLLESHNIHILAHTKSVSNITATTFNESEIEKNPVRCADPAKAKEMISAIEAAKKEGDSLGGVIEAVIRGCPVGLGDPVFDKLDALLAAAIMSIGTIKGIEFGEGFAITKMKGSESNDEFFNDGGIIKTRTNHSGGILGGISSGEDIILRAAIKPPSSISKFQKTVSKSKKPTEIQVTGRHDPCICPRVVPVIEAMIAVTLADCLLVQKSVVVTGESEEKTP